MVSTMKSKLLPTLCVVAVGIILGNGRMLRVREDFTWEQPRTKDTLSSSMDSQSFNETSCFRSIICADLFHNQPSLVSECLSSPGLLKCNLNCADIPEATKKIATSGNPVPNPNSNTTTLWPPLDQGRWIKDPAYCQKVQNTSQACLFDKHRFNLPNKTIDIFSPESACSLLQQHNVTDIVVTGDSLLRHLYQGLTMVLTGNHCHDFGKGPKCACEMAYSEKYCRKVRPLSVCSFGPGNTSINIRFENNNPRKPHPPIQSDNSRGKMLHLYGVGNHAASGRHGPTNRLGILNATNYKRRRWNQFTQPHFWGKGHYLIWIPPHFKMAIGRHDETNERALSFLQESHDFFAALQAPTLNTYTVTKTAIALFSRQCKSENISGILNAAVGCQYFERETCQPTTETWDGYHFGRGINTWKAHLVLNRFRQIASSASVLSTS